MTAADPAVRDTPAIIGAAGEATDFTFPCRRLALPAVAQPHEPGHVEAPRLFLCRYGPFVNFVVTFELEPAAMFGLPQDQHTVLPSGPQTIESAAYHRTGVRASWGTLSRYRPDDDKLAVAFNIGELAADLTDNFLRVRVTANGHGDALDTAGAAADLFAECLGLYSTHVVIAKPILVEGDGADATPARTMLSMGWTTTYDVAELRTNVESAAMAAALQDERLARALRYYHHGMWLFEQQAKLADPFSVDGAMLISSVFLNLWKAASAVVGDPTKDKDHQTRYRTLEFDDEYFRTRIKPLRDLRNESDVAHYSLRGHDLAQLNEIIGVASNVVQELLRAHVRLVQCET